MGFVNHEKYCKGLLRAEPASLSGRIFKLSARVPVMTVPAEHVLAQGSADIAADMRLQERPESFLRGREDGKERETAVRTGCAWRKVYGELFYFGDPESRLPSLDALEEFKPGQPSVYNRVLVYVMLPDGSETTAWVYVAGSDTGRLEEYEGEKWFPDQGRA